MTNSEIGLHKIIEAVRGHLPADALPFLESTIRTYGDLRVSEANIERLTKDIAA